MGEKDFDFLCLDRIEFAKALGFKTLIESNGLEAIVENQIQTLEDVENLKKRRYFNYDYFKKELEYFKKKKEKMTQPLGGGCFGPLTIASSIIGISQANKMVIKNPIILKELTSYINEFMIEFAIEEEKLGADFFWIAEPVASLFSPKLFNEFSGDFLKNIFDSIEIPGFLHVCGKTIKHTEYMVKTGAQVLSIDYVTDIVKNIRIIPEDVVIMGNINPITLYKGSREEVAHEVNKLNYELRNYKNFIMSTGCLIPSKTSIENVNLLVDLTRNYELVSNKDFREIRKLMDLSLNGFKLDLIEYIEGNKVRNYCINEAIKETELILGNNDEEYENILDCINVLKSKLLL